MSGVGQTAPAILQWYQRFKGTSNGIPVAYVAANMEPAAFYQSETDSFLHSYGISICGNDYTATNSKSIRNLFVTASATNTDPRPVFVAINCVSNSPSHAHWQVLLREFYNGGSGFDFSSRIAIWRNIIDSVQAPPPLITGARFPGSDFEFTIPGQRGRTNRIEFTSGFSGWTTLTNVFGTNAPVRIRDTNAPADPHRFYRVVRP
jgi:hypothetical protein